MKKQKLKQLLINEHGEANFISLALSMIVIVMAIVVVLNVFSIISAKIKLDHVCEQMTKQIQLAGGINEDTDTLFHSLTDDLAGVTNCQYTVSADYMADTPDDMTHAIQLSTLFYLDISANATLGGFGDILAVPFTITSSGTGVGERYWK